MYMCSLHLPASQGYEDVDRFCTNPVHFNICPTPCTGTTTCQYPAVPILDVRDQVTVSTKSQIHQLLHCHPPL
jgi:hypothetical protein